MTHGPSMATSSMAITATASGAAPRQQWENQNGRYWILIDLGGNIRVNKVGDKWCYWGAHGSTIIVKSYRTQQWPHNPCTCMVMVGEGCVLMHWLVANTMGRGGKKCLTCQPGSCQTKQYSLCCCSKHKHRTSTWSQIILPKSFGLGAIIQHYQQQQQWCCLRDRVGDIDKGCISITKVNKIHTSLCLILVISNQLQKRHEGKCIVKWGDWQEDSNAYNTIGHEWQIKRTQETHEQPSEHTRHAQEPIELNEVKVVVPVWFHQFIALVSNSKPPSSS